MHEITAVCIFELLNRYMEQCTSLCIGRNRYGPSRKGVAKYTCRDVCIWIHMVMHEYVDVCVCLYICIHTNMYIYTYMCMCVYVPLRGVYSKSTVIRARVQVRLRTLMQQADRRTHA